MELICHPETPCGLELGLSARAEWCERGQLLLRYHVTGDVTALALADAAIPQRSHELWRQTCFEAFVRTDHAGSYREYNFAPSGAWAAYDFSGYRAGMRDAEVVQPEIEVERGQQHLDLSVLLTLPEDMDVNIGLTAVLEERNGRISYWSLQHPPGRPDFHHPTCFALELPAPDAA